MPIDDESAGRSQETGDDPAEATRSIELVRRAQGGDLDAYNRLVERYYERVLHIVRIRLGPRMRSYTEAEDVVQDTFIAAINAFDRFEMRTESSLIHWLSRLAEHKIKESVDYHHAQKRDKRRERALAHVRSAMASGTLQLDPPASVDLPVEQVADRELTAILESCMHELSDDHRDVILLRLYMKGSWAWVAKRMGRPSEGAARELFRRAKIALVALVGQRIEMPGD